MVDILLLLECWCLGLLGSGPAGDDARKGSRGSNETGSSALYPAGGPNTRVARKAREAAQSAPSAAALKGLLVIDQGLLGACALGSCSDEILACSCVCCTKAKLHKNTGNEKARSICRQLDR